MEKKTAIPAAVAIADRFSGAVSFIAVFIVSEPTYFNG